MVILRIKSASIFLGKSPKPKKSSNAGQPISYPVYKKFEINLLYYDTYPEIISLQITIYFMVEVDGFKNLI